MPTKIPDNIQQGLQSELVGLKARIAATVKTDPDDERIAGWEARIKEISAVGGKAPKAKGKAAASKERAVDNDGLETPEG